LSEKEILQRLVVDETETLKRIVGKAERILKIDKKTGETLISAPRSKLTDKDQISVLLLGRYFANRLGLVNTDSMTVAEIADKLTIEEKAASARLSELKRERITENVSRGEYRISYVNVERMLDELGAKVGD